MTRKPNLIMIMTDEMRGDCMGYAGHPDVKTPYLDIGCPGDLLSQRLYSLPQLHSRKGGSLYRIIPEASWQGGIR